MPNNNMPTCHNPYHFVPVSKRTAVQREQDMPLREEAGGRWRKAADGATTHERYEAGTHSGRLVCKLTTRTPLVVGAQQSRVAGQIGEVTPYLRQGPGEPEARPAIPGSSLRGLVSSLAEAASNSAARVLTKGVYSYRKPFGAKALSAIGMVVGLPGKWMLKPVSLPTLERGRDGSYVMEPKWRPLFPQPVFKMYIGGRKADGSDDIRTDQGWRTGAIEPKRVHLLRYNREGNVDPHPSLHHPTIRGRRDERYVVAQDEAPAGEGTVVKGVLRVLGCWGPREEPMPKGKKHELWIPAPGPNAKLVPLDQKVVDRFHDIADGRTEESDRTGGPNLPFHPVGQPRNGNKAELGNKFRLKAGDLVYFEFDNGRVTEIALSAIWRGRVETAKREAAGAIEFFEAVDPDLLPFDRKKRNRVTIAERMFGFVEEREKEDGVEEQAIALASRIRFSDGVLPSGVTREQALERDLVPLRILSSPKPPCPSLYFKMAAGANRWVEKQNLRPGTHAPQGRKMYLHHRIRPGTRPWATGSPLEHADQKNRVQPVREGQEFFFDIDFANLTDAEMGLLLYALVPDGGFCHKLGMGKPLGLGSVKIAVLEWRVVDRKARYTLAGLQGARESRVVRPEDAGFWSLRDKVIASGLVGREMHAAITALGNWETRVASELVHVPTTADQIGVEKETFAWFVLNDGRDLEVSERQCLRPLAETNGVLPPLQRLARRR